jgi:hypothetical protein
MQVVGLHFVALNMKWRLAARDVALVVTASLKKLSRLSKLIYF